MICQKLDGQGGCLGKYPGRFLAPWAPTRLLRQSPVPKPDPSYPAANRPSRWTGKLVGWQLNVSMPAGGKQFARMCNSWLQCRRLISDQFLPGESLRRGQYGAPAFRPKFGELQRSAVAVAPEQLPRSFAHGELHVEPFHY